MITSDICTYSFIIRGVMVGRVIFWIYASGVRALQD